VTLRIVHIISGLGVGGAEMMLYKLVSKTDKSESECVVISLTSKGVIAEKIQELDIPVYCLGMKYSFSSLWALIRLGVILIKERPDVVQTWMYHADIIGGLVAKLVGKKAIVWNIRHSDLDLNKDKKTTIWAAKIGAKLSSFIPLKIISCSKTALNLHARLGYREEKMTVVPNGFDLGIFTPSEEIRLSKRLELGLDYGDTVIGLFGRFHPQKDHYGFIQSAAGLCRNFPRIKFLLCGRDVDWNNEKLVSWIGEHNIRSKFLLLGERNDMADLTKVIDISVSSSSHGEGFSNVIGEAMACGVPCVVTDVGDSAIIVGDTGRVVAPGSPGELELAIFELISLTEPEFNELKGKARLRIEKHYGLASVLESYNLVYREITLPNTS